MESSESRQQFLILRSREISWGRERTLDKERIIRETERWDEECMMNLLKTVKIKGVQGPGVNLSGDVLLGSVLFEDFTWLGNGLRIFVVSNSYSDESLKQEISAVLVFIHAKEISNDTNYNISVVLRRTRRKPTVISKGVQDPGLNPSRDILLRSTLFEDSTWLGIRHWVFIVSYSYSGGSLKQEISTILLFSFIGGS